MERSTAESDELGIMTDLTMFSYLVIYLMLKLCGKIGPRKPSYNFKKNV